MPEAQTYKTHVRKLPYYYKLVFLAMLANIAWSGYRLLGGITGDAVMHLLISIVLPFIAVSSRAQTLRVQNRVVRLEMRLRFRELLTRDVAERACALPVGQIAALRFASDEELPGLVDDVLAGRLSEPDAIKQKVRNWQGDFLRA